MSGDRIIIELPGRSVVGRIVWAAWPKMMVESAEWVCLEEGEFIAYRYGKSGRLRAASVASCFPGRQTQLEIIEGEK
jgi:hypothetical protein